MIPSNRRRLRNTAFALVVLLVVVVGAVVLFGGSSGNRTTQSATHRPANRQQDLAIEDTLGIAYGATPKQVQAQLGSPTIKHGNCWIYQGQPGTVRGLTANSTVDAFKFCFGEAQREGRLSRRS
jgi:hypothetical protein